MKGVHVYLMFDGNAAEAFEYYKSVFGGEFAGGMQRFGDMPGGDPNMSDAQKNRVLHVVLPLKEGYTLMGSDTMDGMGPKLVRGTGSYVSIDAESEEEARRLFAGLAEGGTVQMPLDKTFWAKLFGMCTDKFGIQWMVNLD